MFFGGLMLINVFDFDYNVIFKFNCFDLFFFGDIFISFNCLGIYL